VNVPTDVVTRNRKLQVEYYGEPLGDRLRRLLDRLGWNQLQLAELLGLSPSMLSQLMSAHRAKISNPAVLTRLHLVESMTEAPGWHHLPPDEQLRRLAEVRDERATATSPATVELRRAGDVGSSARPAGPVGAPAPADPIAAVQALLRAVASATEIEAAADRLAADFPDLAQALRILGNGRTTEARAYRDRLLQRE
jgi:transcriptional regulator with XRE-family HTH domain